MIEFKMKKMEQGTKYTPTYLNSLNNAILRANLPKSKGSPAAYGG